MPSSQLLEIAVRVEIDIALGDRMVLVIVIKLYVLHLDNANSRYKSHSRQRKRKCDAMRCDAMLEAEDEEPKKTLRRGRRLRGGTKL